MKWFERIVLAVGFATLGFLLWKFNPSQIWDQISFFRAGFAIILPLQVFDQLFNSFGWHFTFNAQDAHRVPLKRLFLGRLAGDGVNYLTPSGTIAGEFIRPAMLKDVDVPDDAKNASVFVAKFSQSMAQPLFILLGIIFVLQGQNILSGKKRLLAAAFAVSALIFLSCALYFAAGGSSLRPGKSESKWATLRLQIHRYLTTHPARFILSVACFTAGYAWGAAEAFIICRFMGMQVPVLSAIAIEVLSNIVDSLFFMVPAKVGTQEAGKIAIFHWLGYPAGQGLTFGLIRHIRELLWMAFGFLIYIFNRRSRLVRKLD